MKKLSKSLTHLKEKPLNEEKIEKEIEELQLTMLQIQQGVWHSNKRVMIVFEGFDAAGKGGAIKALTKNLDPRGVKVIPIGPPTKDDQSRHWLYRFWKELPLPGNIVIFDRSWYGRVLVERVDELIPPKRWKEAFDEINQFEKMLESDGVIIIKFFLAISKDEQFDRLEARVTDPKKIWKVSMDDIKARKKWDEYVKSADDILSLTNTKKSPWTLITTNQKKRARKEVLVTVNDRLKDLKDASKSELDLKKFKKELVR